VDLSDTVLFHFCVPFLFILQLFFLSVNSGIEAVVDESADAVYYKKKKMGQRTDTEEGEREMERFIAHGGETVEGSMQPLTSTLFDEFVRWIDRGERTTRTYLTNLRQFMAWLKFSGCSRPTRQDILAYREWLCTEHDAIRLAPDSVAGWVYRTDGQGRPIRTVCKASTARIYLQSVRQFFHWTASMNLYPDIASNIHMPKINMDIHRKDALKPEEVLTIEVNIQAEMQESVHIAAAAKRDTAGRIQRSREQGARLFAMYLLAANCGLRTVELARANVRDVETRDGQTWMYIWGKGHSEADQRIPLAPEVARAITDYLQLRMDSPVGNSPLFVSTGNRSGGKRIRTTTISTMLKRAMQAAGFDSERLTAHSLRHTAGTAAMEVTGDNIFQVQTYMRHMDPKTTEIYTHREREEVQAEVARKIYNLYHGGANCISPRQKLEQLLNRLSTSQIERLVNIAEEMAEQPS